MVLRIAFALALSMSLGYACDCADVSVSRAKAGADIIFRGTITGFRTDNKRTGLDDWGRRGQNTKGIVVFRVTRVWKGDVAPSFEMPAAEETAMCWGFWPDDLKVGNELLVYAVRDPGTHEYYTNICARTTLAKSRSKDFDELVLARSRRSRGTSNGNLRLDVRQMNAPLPYGRGSEARRQ
jgi:hypothetical protein